MYKMILICFALILAFSSLNAKISPRVELVIRDGEKCPINWGNSIGLQTKWIRFRVVIDGSMDEAKQAAWYWSIHMSGDRTCQIPYGGNKRVSFSEIWDFTRNVGKEITFEGYTGLYYVKFECTLNGQTEHSNSQYVFLFIPPVKSYSEPYSYPSSNSVGDVQIQVLNMDSKRKLQGPVLEFVISKVVDSNVELGVFTWKTMTPGAVHVPNYNAPRERDQKKCFIHYSDWHGKVLKWDTRDNPAVDFWYSLEAHFYDEHGLKKASNKIDFYYNPDDVGGGDPLPPPDPDPEPDPDPNPEPDNCKIIIKTRE